MFVSIDGTHAQEKWRDRLAGELSENEDIFLFDPENATGEQFMIMHAKYTHKCCDDLVLYVVTPGIDPFLAAEVTRRAFEKPEKTMLCLLKDYSEGGRKFKPGEYNSWDLVADQVKRNGVKVFKNLAEVVTAINQMADSSEK